MTFQFGNPIFGSTLFSDFTNPEFQRERPNLIFGFIEGYRQDGDARWLAQLRNVVGQSADLSNKQWVTDPAVYGATHPHVPDESGYLRMFQFNQTVWSLGLYLDFADEYGLADALAYAYKYSGEDRFLNAASRFYATGTTDPFWEGDPPVYHDTKDLVNSLNWGLVYMNQSAKTPEAANSVMWWLY